MKKNSEKKYVPVNKGHFELDTEARTEKFQEKMAYGWEDDYKLYRRLWNELPERREVTNYPLLVDLELADVCNLRCPMCPTRTEEFKKLRGYGFMDTALAKKIIDEIKGKVYALRLSWAGEATLHPDFIEIIKYASDAGIKEIAFLTNGSNMSLDFFKRVTEAGATWITWSVDGLEEQYEAIRKPLIFEETLQKLRDISEYKKQVKLIKPLLKVQCVWPAIKDDPEKFYNTIAPLCDLVAYNPLIDYLHKDCDIVYEEGFSCPQHYQRVVIASDGRACMCSGDGFVECPVGDARIQSVYDIWHGDVFERMREIHASDKGFLKLECCRKCFYPRKTEPDESAWVNGRKIIIENYINRSQVIGE